MRRVKARAIVRAHPRFAAQQGGDGDFFEDVFEDLLNIEALLAGALLRVAQYIDAPVRKACRDVAPRDTGALRQSVRVTAHVISSSVRVDVLARDYARHVNALGTNVPLARVWGNIAVQMVERAVVEELGSEVVIDGVGQGRPTLGGRVTGLGLQIQISVSREVF